MVQWGAQHGDNDSANNLYDLTDEDLKYLFDRDGNGDPVYQTQSGAAQTLTAEEQNEALDVDGFKDQVTYKDAFGRRYDPSTLTSVGGPRDGNAYIINGQRYTRVRAMQNNGGTVYQYARIIDDGEPLEDAYNMGSIMDMLVQHGTDLRNDRKQRYLAAGAAATTDTTFVYQERDATYENLYGQATDQDAGGREYSGYRITHADYVENQSDVFNAELQQRVVVQEKEWDLREQELNDRYEEWERKMDLLLTRGRGSWGNAENRFLQEWREWERKLDNDEAEGNRKWDEQIAKHFEKKEQWEEDVRDRASEENLTAVLTESVNELNNQIAIANQNMGANMASISTTAYVNEILAGLENDKPSFTEKFQRINSNIKDFKTKLSVSELTGANLGQAIAAVDADYREELRIHAKNLKVLANVKVFEEYRKLFDGFAAQLEDQNEIIDQQTQTAAFNAGFVRSGAFFVKSGNISDALGVVNAYEYFDTAGVLREELDKSGFKEMDGGELTTFLAGKDDVEVEAYFHVQKLALQRVYEVLMGRGTQEERRNSQDERVIGRFGTWAGRAPGGSNGEANLAQNAVSAAKIDLADGGNALNALRYLGFAGFGEQGVMGVRPGGAPLGFYPQLELASMLTGRGDSDGLASAADPTAAYGPLSNTFLADMATVGTTFMNQYNVPLMLMNSYKNVQLATKVHGKDAGYMWEAQALNLLKAPLAATGGVITGIGAAMAVATGPVGLLVAAAGMGITSLANSLQVNPTTGERMVKMTDEAAVSTAAITLTSFLGGAGSELVKAGQMAGTTLQSATMITGASTGALQQTVNYDASGRAQGMSLGGFNGANAAIAGATGIAAGLVGQSMGELGGVRGAFRSDAISTGFGVAAEYGKYSARGAGNSGFMSMYNVDGNRFGSMLGMGLSTALNDAREEQLSEQDRIARERAMDALKHGQKHQARDILAGAGYSAVRRERILAQLQGSSQASATTGLIANRGSGGGLLEKLGNFFSADYNGEYFNWRTDAENRAGAGEAFFDAFSGGASPERQQALLDYIFPGQGLTPETFTALQQQNAPSMNRQQAANIAQAILQHNDVKLTRNLSDRIFAEMDFAIRDAGGASLNDVLGIVREELGGAPNLPSPEQLKDLVGAENRRINTVWSNRVVDDFDYTHRYAKHGAVQHRIATISRNLRKFQGGQNEGAIESQVRREIDKEFGAGTYDATIAQRDGARKARTPLQSALIAFDQYASEDSLLANFAVNVAAPTASFFGFQGISDLNTMRHVQTQQAYAGVDLARKALSPEEYAAFNIQLNREVAVYRAGYNTAEAVGTTAASFAAGPAVGLAGRALMASRAGLMATRAGQAFGNALGAAAGRAVTTASVYSSYGVRVGTRIAAATAREIPQIARVAGQQAARASQHYGRLAAGASRQYAAAAGNTASYAGRSALGGSRFYLSGLVSSHHGSGFIGGTLNASVNLVANEDANWLNTATAFGAGYATGYAGSFLGGRQSPNVLGTLGLGFGVGGASDLIAQTIEIQSGLSKRADYDAWRAVAGAVGGSLSAGAAHLLYMHKSKPLLERVAASYGQLMISKWATLIPAAVSKYYSIQSRAGL